MCTTSFETTGDTVQFTRCRTGRNKGRVRFTSDSSRTGRDRRRHERIEEDKKTRVPSGSGCEMSSRYTSWVFRGCNGNSTSFTEVRSNPGTESLELILVLFDSMY